MALLDHLNSSLANLPVYQPGRPIEEVARELGINAADIIKLASNENPLGPSRLALQALEKQLSNLHLYPDGNAFYLKRKLAQHLEVETENLILGNGSNEIIEFLGHALIRPGVDVVVSEYSFAVYPIVTHLFGGNLITVPAKSYGHDLKAMRKAITPKTRVIFVANPNNPTGTVASRGDIVEFVNEAPEDVLIAMDEAYIDFLDHPVDFVPLIRGKLKPNLLLMRTFSKIYGLAGLRVGYGIASAESVKAFEKIRQPFNLNAMAQVAALAALDDNEHLRLTKRLNREGLDFYSLAFRKLGLEFIESCANFIMVKVGDGAGVFQALQKAGVIARPMASYKLPEWIRISIGTTEENSRCLAALTKALERS
ncbi:MAG TPA: histidinol-phosphate transaminase [Methylomirabilota bacterium]|nr:histidinol-phosphate transaminase [Methylomirabilota bacterium]